MLFSTLTYPVEQPYRLRWITEIFYFGSAIIVVLLVVFNVALVGYEEVIVLRKDPNITDYDQWWAPKSLPSALRFRTTPGECQETNLPRNTLLRTNSSLPLFTYSLINNLENFDAQKDEFGLRSETPYKANPMDICRVENMSLTMEPRILSFAISTTIICDPVGVPPRARRFQTWFKGAQDDRYRPDSILEYLSYRATPNDTDIASYQKLSKDGPPRNTYLNVLGVIDGLHADLMNLMWMRKSTLTHMNDTSSEYPPELASMAWDSQLDSRLPADMSRLLYWGTYTEGWWTQYDAYIGTMNRTIANLFVAIRDAIYLDVGKIMPTNIYTNKTSLNNLIRVDKYSTELSQAMFEIYDWQDLNSDPTCSRGWGCLDFNTTWAEAFTSTNGSVNNITLPIIPDNGTASVIDMTYLCPQYRMKSLGDLLMSVFIGTFTMYVTLYGIFAWLAPALDQQRKGPQPSERFITGQSLGPDYELQVGSLTPRSSSYVPPYDSLGFDDDQKRLLDDEKDKTP